MNTNSSSYRLLELIALSGELSPELVTRIGISPSYSDKLITQLKDNNYIKTHYKNRLRGYRLTSKGKKLLLSINPDRFLFYLSGSSETNQPRSELPRRLRLHSAARTYVLLQNANIGFFRDKKPLLFSGEKISLSSLPLPIFYHSREIKELGLEATKINNSRVMGILLSTDCIYPIYYTGNAPIKWGYRTEIKVKALLTYHITRGILSPWYPPDTPIKALFIGNDMETSNKLLTSNGGYNKGYFYLDTSYDYYHYISDSVASEFMLQLLCSSPHRKNLEDVLLSDLQPPNPQFGLEHDAVMDNLPLLLAYDYDLLKISRYQTALSFHGLKGSIICFDFQKAILQQYFGETAAIKTIDLIKFKRRFYHEE